ncbi:MAG: endolytic transglycosylase MltG, partial [Pseudomonadales bacterium]
LKRRHLRTPSPYNTYTIPRLPIGPICNPGAGSIAAALNPPESDYLYFVAKGDGTSYFSTSLEEHNAAVVQFQKAGWVKNYSSTPMV